MNQIDLTVVNQENIKTPLISVVTVSFNCVKNIEKTICSVINQTYKNIEYIIIDGGSTDGTLDIIKKYDRYISYWKSGPDKGIYDAMNKAIKIANGQWISFMNCGDLFYNENVLSEVFNSDTSEFDVIYGSVQKNWGDGKKLIVYPDEVKSVEMPFCHQSSFVKTQYMKEFLFDTHYKVVADRNFFIQINKKYGKKWLYKNITIAEIDCADSFSIHNEVLAYKESCEIMDIKGIRYFYGLFKIIFRGFLSNAFPHLVILRRKIRIFMQGR